MRVMEERRAGPVRSTPSAAKRFADALLGRTPASDVRPGDDVGSAAPLRAEQSRLVEHFRWLMAIMPSRAGLYQRQLEERLAEEASEQAETSSFAKRILEAEWDSSKHPRRGGPPNGGWFADKGTGTTATGGANAASDKGLHIAPVSFKSGKANKRTLIDLIDRKREIDNLAGGGPSRQTKRTQGVAAKITSAGKLPGAIASGLSSGAKTGGKSLINGGATAIKNVATLGLSSSQLELIGVTDEDRANGYDTAVSIATASGEVLIAVGTGGIAAALRNGGTVARAVHGVLVVHDAAGNAVGVVQGIYDAKTNGVTVSGGASVAANALGLSASIRPLPKATAPAAAPNAPAAPRKAMGHQPAKPTTKYKVGPHKDMPSPREGNHSHHAVMSEWMRQKFRGYDKDKAPAVLMPDTDHLATYGVYLRWRKEIADREGSFEWRNISEDEMRALAEKQFDAAAVPPEVRQQYWAEFDRMKTKLTGNNAKIEEARWSTYSY